MVGPAKPSPSRVSRTEGPSILFVVVFSRRFHVSSVAIFRWCRTSRREFTHETRNEDREERKREREQRMGEEGGIEKRRGSARARAVYVPGRVKASTELSTRVSKRSQPTCGTFHPFIDPAARVETELAKPRKLRYRSIRRTPRRNPHR